LWGKKEREKGINVVFGTAGQRFNAWIDVRERPMLLIAGSSGGVGWVFK